eukprot:INCI12169.2.p1 GENE.INCI12169.2~~INCI12169.2.p1  ORF type:complete len:539 (-),score=65.97 INCI12169.2:265-1881(-)
MNTARMRLSMARVVFLANVVALLVPYQPCLGADADSRRMPKFVHVLPAQEFDVHLPLTLNNYTSKKPAKNKQNKNSTLVKLALFSVIPDVEAGQAFLLFSFQIRDFNQFVQRDPATGVTCHGHQCTDLLPHFQDPFMGQLRCQFLHPNGALLDATPSRVEAHAGKIAPFSNLVGKCALPPEFTQILADDDFQQPPGIRVLREDDTAAAFFPHDSDPNVRLAAAADFDVFSGVSCAQHFFPADDGTSTSADQCAAKCVEQGMNQCVRWLWSPSKGCLHSPTTSKRKSKCSTEEGWVGGIRRHPAWQAVDTSRTAPNRRLISFGCSMPVFGDGSYANRIPQWLEFQLYNFPDTHFFVYLHDGAGGDALKASPQANPGIVGGAAVLYPYIEAGVLTVIWLPRDTNRLLDSNVDGFQRRDENDYLYRTRHFSEWASASVDYDEFFAPTYTLSTKGYRKINPGSRFDLEGAYDVDFTKTAAGSLFYPIAPYLQNVSSEIQALSFHKWPTETPAQQTALYLSTQRIARDLTKGMFNTVVVCGRF